MTIEQIERFVRKIVKKGIYLVFHEDPYDDTCAYVYQNKPRLIHINLPRFNKFPLLIQKGTLMHEIGHTQTLPTFSGKNKDEKMRSQEKEKGKKGFIEFDAEVWGIKKAERLGMIQVAHAMRNSLRKWSIIPLEKRRNEDSIYYRYFMASQMAKQKNII